MAKIYQKEIQDGLSSYFEKPLSATYTLALSTSATTKVKSINNIVGKLKEDDFLYEYPSILVTAGIWNDNYQVFDKDEVWKARYTPLNKPANINHEPDKVVAHTSKVFAITDETEARLIPDTVDGKPNEDIPNKYHLLTVDNFYKYNSKPYQNRNPEYSTKIQDLYEKVQAGNLAVSMECIFEDFDYAIMYADGTQKIIQRNDETSFLSKKLRSFGGTGEYEGKKIGILMRNLMFTGKGITDNPANKESVIFPKECLLFATQNYVKAEDIFNIEKQSAYILNDNGEQTMNDELKAKVSELEAALKAKTEELAEANKLKSELDTLKTELAAVTEKLTKAEQANKETQESLKTSNTSLTELNTKLESTSKDLESANKEVVSLKAEKLKTERVEKIKETLSLTKEESEANHAVVANLNDEAFGNWLENTKKLLENKMASKNELEAQVAKAKKEAEETNKKLAEAQAKELEVANSNLGVASVEKTNGASASLKNVFSKKD